LEETLIFSLDYIKFSMEKMELYKLDSYILYQFENTIFNNKKSKNNKDCAIFKK